MIEVEMKIEAGCELMEYLSKQGKLLSEKVFSDTYYDTQDYLYTSQNMWLRKREEAFELKKIVKENKSPEVVRLWDKMIDRYEEITDCDAILLAMNIPKSSDFLSSLKLAKLAAFASFQTHRKKYRFNCFVVDVDEADFGDFTYPVAEIECIVEDESEISQAEQRIHDFLKKLRVTYKEQPCSKLEAYLSRKRPDHFLALKKAGVF